MLYPIQICFVTADQSKFYSCRKRQINKPRPVDEDDMEAIFKQAKEEQVKADQAYEEEQLKAAASNPENLGVDSPLVSQNIAQTKPLKKTGGRGRKSRKETIEGMTISIKLGSTVQVMSGAFAGFSGTLKKFDSKTGLVCYLAHIMYYILSINFGK